MNQTYSILRNAILNVIPGYCVSDYVYLGMIVFIIAGFVSSKKWAPFFATIIFTLIWKILDFIILVQNAQIVIIQFLHMITLPLIVTILYRKKQ